MIIIVSTYEHRLSAAAMQAAALDFPAALTDAGPSPRELAYFRAQSSGSR